MSSRVKEVLRQQFLNGVVVREHADDLVDRNPCSLDASLAVADRRINGNPLKRHLHILHNQFT